MHSLCHLIMSTFRKSLLSSNYLLSLTLTMFILPIKYLNSLGGGSDSKSDVGLVALAPVEVEAIAPISNWSF